jgi:uncharacterized protein YegJ (DUF2314 family)
MRLHFPKSARRIIAVASVFIPAASFAQKMPELGPNAPRDKGIQAIEECQLRHWNRAIQPYVDSARATFPAAKARFLAGLPPRHTLYVTVRLTDEEKLIEQVFIAVDSIRNDRVFGRIASQIELVRGYKYGQSQSVAESEVMDWMISRPDGSEEGNLVGKFQDNYQPPTVCSMALLERRR